MKILSNVEQANRVVITDTNNNFVATNVEDALQEIFSNLINDIDGGLFTASETEIAINGGTF